jgi:hypothetical protein
MGCDMVVALGAATAHGHTLVGVNLYGSELTRCTLRRWPAGSHSPDEHIQTDQLTLPQVRQTCAVFGLQPENGWGFSHGCNEHQVVVGAARWRCRAALGGPGLTGPDLVRLTLERSHSAVHAVEVLTDLISRHRHGGSDTEAGSVFLIAGGQEAYVLEAAGSCWALQECKQARAVVDVALIRQDWQRLSPGLAEYAVQQGWWQDDGTKLDFAGSLGQSGKADAWPLRRWGKATLALAQQGGALNLGAMRRFLSDHFEVAVRAHELAPRKTRLLASVVWPLSAGAATMAWFANGGTTKPLYFPLVVDAEIPEAWATRPPVASGDLAANRGVVDRLQPLFDQDAEEFLHEARTLRERGEQGALARLAQAMMQKHLEQWHGESGGSTKQAMHKTRPRSEEEEMAPFAFG